MFGDFEKMQADMQQKLATIHVEGQSGDGAITVTMNAAITVENVKIDMSKFDLSDSEQLEDLLVVAMNAAIEKAQIKAAAESQKLMNQMLPGGLGSLGSLFGK
jgi:nucleoid-associated protein EbfC